MAKDKIRSERFLARKYKAMGLPVQRRTAVEYALFYRRLQRFN